MLCQRWANSFITPQGANVEISQIRGRKRGRKQLSRAEKLARRQLKEQKLADKKTFMQRVQLARIRQAREIVQWPPRYDETKEKNLEEKPAFNIYFVKNVKTRYYPFSEAIEMHRRLQSPAIYGNPSALLKLRMELNMSTEKSTKFIGASRQLIIVPFPFKHSEKRTILAFAQSQEMQDQAIAAGADLALGQDSVKKILKGRFMIDDYDFCVAHEDMAHAIMPLRGVLKSRFPTRINGGIGSDLNAILSDFLSGVNLIVKPNVAYPEWGLCEPIIGRLDMPNEELEANAGALVSELCKQRNPALGPFINRALLMTIPGRTYYSVDISAWEPIASEEDTVKLEKRQKKKKEKKAEEEQGKEAVTLEDRLINWM